jgi:hypothetical protein
MALPVVSRSVPDGPRQPPLGRWTAPSTRELQDSPQDARWPSARVPLGDQYGVETRAALQGHGR